MRGVGVLRAFCGFGLALSVLLFAAPVHADAAQRVYVGVYLHDVTKFDQKDGVFDVDIELWVKWFGEFDPARVSIANAATVDRALIGEESDGGWHSTRWRVRGTLRGEFPLHRFPFDAQTLAVTLELPDRYGDLVPDLAGSGMREHFGITGWNYDPWFRPNVSRTVYRSDLGSIESEGRPTMVHRVSFEVVLRRPMVTVGLKFFLPLLVILLVALIALFLPADRVDARTGIGVTALLSTFAFQFAIADTMPNVTYLTVADVMFMVSYGLVAALLALSIVSFFLDSNERKAGARRLDRIARLVVPVLGITPAIVLARPPRAPVHVHAPAPRPVARHATSRDVLRVGLFGLTGTTSGILFHATQWSCLRRGADGVRRPVLAEEAPSISNDALHFLAGGAFEVTWRLRPGLRWSDGAPMVADDLVFAERVSPDPHTLGVSAVDRLTAVMRYDDRIASLLDDFTPMPRHALDAVFRQGGYEAVREYRRTHPVPTSGPYRLVEFVASDHAVLEANPYFSGGRPAIRRIELRRFADGDAAVRAFEAGQIDVTWPNTITPDQARAFATRRPDAVHVRPANMLVFLNLDLTVPALSRVEVRRAIAMAIDRERLRAEVYGPDARVTSIPVLGELPAGAAPIAHDVEAARALLHAAGVEGTHVALVHGAVPVDRQIAARIVEDLAAIGLVVDTREANNLADLFRGRTHGGMLLHAMNTSRDDTPRRFWNLPLVSGNYSRTARNAAYDDDVAALAEREERAMYAERRAQLRDRLLAAFVERLPNIPLVFGIERILADPHLRGWEHVAGVDFGVGVEDWYFDAAQ